MGRIPEEIIQTVRERIDLAELVGRHVTLTKKGASFWGLCPFHGEKTPSFHVRPDRGFYHCFGCDESGNAFDFLIRFENLTFPEAVRSLAGELGIEVPESGGGEPGLMERLTKATDTAQALYRSALAAPQGAGARRYLEGRGLDASAIEAYGIGYAPDGWDTLVGALAKEKIPAEIGGRAGLLRERESGGYYDLLRDRLVFPIQDARGRVMAFGGRALADEQQPKYLNSSESPLFRKREALYGLPHALEAIRRNDRIVVVEGYFDRIALARAGVEETVATCGTALAEGHARSLLRRSRNVVLLFDGDEAGQRAALRALETLLPHGLRVCAAALPPGMDPDDLLGRDGPEALRKLVDDAPPAMDLAIRRAVAAGCATPWEKSDAVAAVVPLLLAVRDRVERGEWCRRLALATGVEPAEVEAALRREHRGEDPAENTAPVRPRLDDLEERRLADVVGILLCQPGLVPEAAAHGLLASEAEPWAELLAALSLLPELGEVTPETVLARLEGGLGDEARGQLMAIASLGTDEGLGEEKSLRALSDIAAWFERRRGRREQRATTDRLRDPTANVGDVLREKNAELGRRRVALGLETPKS